MKFLILILSMFFTSLATAQTITVDPSRTIYIRGVIKGDIINQAADLMTLADRNLKPIYLIINSPGGQVYPGTQFLTAMAIAKHRSIEIRCIVPIQAASMAFQIFVNCSKRYAFKNSLLLFHPMTVGMNKANAAKLLYSGKRIRALEKPFIHDLLRALNISRRKFFYHYRHQTMWMAREFCHMSPEFLTIIEDVKGAHGLFRLR